MTHSDTELRELDNIIGKIRWGDYGVANRDEIKALITTKLTEARIDQLRRCSDLQHITKRADRIEWVNRELATLQSQETQQ